MPRIFGVDLPREKRSEIALTYLYGIGRTLSNQVLREAGIDPSKRAKDLSDKEVAQITSTIQKMNAKVEGDLRREVQQNIKRLIDIKCYRGSRHIKGLPVRGQRTHTNSRTRKGPRKTVGGLLKKPPAPK
ncbi:MAG: 30S ribosomal protein S13 [Candidatus Omnitrophica bacterium]|nr:30S ribosomal protein S13 [Candidatus Omnitrophota bacterium]